MALCWALVLISVFQWQANSIPYQSVYQAILSLLLVGLAYKNLKTEAAAEKVVIAFSTQGQWDYLEQQSQWQLTARSRVSDWLLWVNLQSILDSKQTHWRLIFKDQCTEQDYRRLCRAIYFQQQAKP